MLFRSGHETVTVHQWDGMDIVMETGLDGVVKSRFLRGANLIAQQIDANEHYYLFNAHGDVVQRVSEHGDVLASYDYDAFGNERDNPLDPNPFRYCAEYVDAESGMVYLRNRYYDPEAGRFVSEDPIRSGANWYAYCSGNPVAFVDPLGLFGAGSWEWFDNASWSSGYINQRLYGDVRGPSSPGQSPNFSGLNWALSVSSPGAGHMLIQQSLQVVASHVPPKPSVSGGINQHPNTGGDDGWVDVFLNSLNREPEYIKDLKGWYVPSSEDLTNLQWDFIAGIVGELPLAEALENNS